MALWLVRAGGDGEWDELFRDGSRIAIGFEREVDLNAVESRDALKSLVQEKYPASSPQRIAASAGQMWTFARVMEKGDWVVVPFKTNRTINIAEIVSDYRHTSDDHPHVRDIRWLKQDIPRSDFEQDLLNSFGGRRTVNRVSRNDAERRIRALVADGMAPPFTTTHTPDTADDDDTTDASKEFIETVAADEIERLIIKNFPLHAMERLVRALLEAQGYTVYHSPKGRDKGIDLLAAPGRLGFGTPRICVQVKSGGGPTDRPTLDQLIGTMQNVQAEQGLLVSWGGFTRDVESEKAKQFFKVRLWDRAALIDQVLEHYEELDSDIKAKLPLKRIWVVIPEPEE